MRRCDELDCIEVQRVRELAQRSANAAKEIKALIANSEVAVGDGGRLVNDTGKGLSEITKLVQTSNAHRDAIVTAAQEQSVGLSEVNTAVNHMDLATQQNAAMVEKMSAAGRVFPVKQPGLSTCWQISRRAGKRLVCFARRRVARIDPFDRLRQRRPVRSGSQPPSREPAEW